MSTCSHGVPRMYRCSCDKPHPHAPEHVCTDGPPRLDSLDPDERAVIMALLNARKHAEEARLAAGG